SASCARRDERGTRTSSPRSGRSSSRRRRERSGPGATSGSFGRLLARDGVSARAGLQVAERRLRDEQRAGPDDGAHLELRGSDDGDALEVAEALRERLLLVRDDEDERALVAPRLDEAGRGLGRGLRPRRAVDERERARLGMAREGAAEGRAPARARPVPFWRHGFARPPATRPRLLAPRVPARSAFCSARTVSWTRCGLISAPKIAASSVTCLEALPALSRSGAWALALGMRLLLSHLDDGVLRAGHGALDEQEAVLRVDVVDDEADLRDALAAEAAGH